jgi:uncharacterized SAM-binding protein YcdF (DUF218 family)
MKNLDAINNHLFFKPAQMDNPDVAILLGARGVSGDIARHAARDYLSGKFNAIVLCGGITVKQQWIPYAMTLAPTLWGITKEFKKEDLSSNLKESDYMREVLLGEGVPKDAIKFTDRQSTNTGENFKNIEGHVLSSGYQSAHIYCVAYGQRRAIETAAHVFENTHPEFNIAPVPVYPYGISRDTWMQKWSSVLGVRGVIKGEFDKTNPNNPKSYHYPQPNGREAFCTPCTIPTLG